MKTTFYLVVCFILALASVEAQTTDRLPTSFLKGRVGVFIEPQVDTSKIIPFRNIVSRDSGAAGARAQFEIGKVFFDGQSYGTALGEFKKVLTNYSRNAASDDAQYYLGQCYSNLMQDSLSVEEARKLMAVSPQGKWVDDCLNLIVRGLFAQQKYREMLQEQTNLSAKHPSWKASAETWLLKGHAHRFLREYQSALTAFEKGQTGQGSSAITDELHLAVGTTRAILGQHDAGIAEVRKAIAASSDIDLKATAQFQVAATYLMKGDQQSALTEFQKVLASYGTHELAPLASFRIGQCLMETKQYQQAIDQFTKTETSYNNFPHRDWLLFFRGKCYWEMGKRPEAKELFSRLITNYPKSSFRPAAEKLLKS